MVSFRIKVGFTNDSSRTFNSTEEFEHYNEIKKLETDLLAIWLTYIIKFPNKDLVERQSIYIHFETQSPMSIGNKLPFENFLTSFEGRIFYRIFYTERSWGDDLDHIISNEVDKVIKRKKNIYVGRLLFFFISSICAYAIILTPIIYTSNNTSICKKKLLDTLPKDIMLLSNDIKIDFLFRLSTLKVNNSGYSIGLTIMGAILSIILIISSAIILKKGTDSFIILTPFDLQQKEKKLKKKGMYLLILILTWIFTIITGVISNILYGKFFYGV